MKGIDVKDGRCKGCKYARVLTGGGWSFVGCRHEPYKGKWVVEIKDCPKEKEEEDFKKKEVWNW